MAQQTSDRLRGRGISIIMVMVAGLLLASCGPIGNDDDTTPTAESVSQPTEAISTLDSDAPGETATVAQDPDSVESTLPSIAASPAANESTVPAAVSSISTPVGESTQASASPASGVQPANNATPSAENTPASGVLFTGDDGTSGATPPVTTQSTPGSLFVPVDNAPESSISPNASPEASPGAGLELVELTAAVVTSCEPEIIPAITLSDVTYSTVSDVNIRSGPGVDCDPLAISPIGEFQLVTLIGGPVIREGEEFIWVQVTAPSGELGWIVTAGISPDE